MISFFIIVSMFGHGKEYEYKDTIYYTVVEGDTLWDIWRRYLGKGYKYVQIVAENETDNPDLIYAGEIYKITISYKEINNWYPTKTIHLILKASPTNWDWLYLFHHAKYLRGHWNTVKMRIFSTYFIKHAEKSRDLTGPIPEIRDFTGFLDN